MNIQATTPNTAAETALIAEFDRRLRALPGDPAVAARRSRAFDLVRKGLPTRRVEAWHYTDLRRLLSSVPAHDGSVGAAPLAPLLEGSAVFPVLNGHAEAGAAYPGISVTPLRAGLEAGRYVEPLAPAAGDDAVGSINAAFVSDGFEVVVPEGAAPDRPVEFQNVQAGGQAHARFAVTIGKGARGTFVERQAGSGAALVSSVTEIDVADEADITWLIVQEQPEDATHLGQFVARLGVRARLRLFVMNAGGRLVRQEIRVSAAGEGADFRLCGVNLLAGQTHCDVTMVLDHEGYGATSTELVRNVVTDRAQGVFQGQIRVRREAQKTDAKMACNTLLLSDEAGFSIKPELEIFADDVACGHGATVTEIERQHLFYLMSRGVEEKLARGLLVKAFLAEVIEELEDEPVVEALEAKLDQWFATHG